MKSITTSQTFPAGGGLLARRIVLSEQDNGHGYCTHMEAWRTSGNCSEWSKFHGRYDFTTYLKALQDFMVRTTMLFKSETP